MGNAEYMGSALMRPQQEQLVIGVRCILRKEIIGKEF